MENLNQTILNNSLLQWLIAVAALLVTVLLLRIVQHLAGRRLTALATRTATQWDDRFVALIARTKLLFLIVVSIFVATLFLDLPDRIQTAVSTLFVIALLIQSGIWGVTFIARVLESYRQHALENSRAEVTTINLIWLVIRIVLWSIVTLLVLDNLGVNVTALVAGLGIGGIAVALALQNILGDLFASLSITFDKPFIIGDFLIIGEHMGSVENVGLKTTRVRSLSGEQLVFSNSDLLNSRIRNYGRMFERRVAFSIGVIYETPREKLRRIPEIIRVAVEAQDETRFDRSHFMKYGDYALMFETVYYVLSPDYNIHMDIQQSIYFAIHEGFEKEGIEFAYPTQKLFVHKD
ncbi:MAG: mechanosensitive ion channel family protein [Porticoccus sp.]